MQKRGAETLILVYALEVLAGVFVALIVIKAGIEFAAGSPAKKDFLAKDIAMQLNALYAVPGNAYLINTEGTANHSFTFSDQKITVVEEKSDVIKGSYRYVPSGNNDLSISLEKPERFILTKAAGAVTVQETTPSLLSINCPHVITRDEDWRDKKIVIDPAQDAQETPIIDTLTEGKITLRIAQTLKKIFNENFILTREDESLLSLEEKRNHAADADAIISVHIGNYPSTLNIAKAYVNFHSPKRRQSVKLACNILNAIAEKADVDAISIVPLSIDTLSDKDKREILHLEDTVVVAIELGNIQTEKGRLMLKTTQIPGMLFKGIQHYYEE